MIRKYTTHYQHGLSSSSCYRHLYSSNLFSSARFSACTLCGKTFTAKKRILFSPLKYSNFPFTIILNVLNNSLSKYACTFSSVSFSLNSLNSSAVMSKNKKEILTHQGCSMLTSEVDINRISEVGYLSCDHVGWSVSHESFVAVLTSPPLSIFCNFPSTVFGHTCWVKYSVVILYSRYIPI
jgi:hypothetical protein